MKRLIFRIAFASALSFMICAPAGAQPANDSSNQNGPPLQTMLVTSQKMVVTSASSKKFCGYLAGDQKKSPVCFPEATAPSSLHEGGPVHFIDAGVFSCAWNETGTSCDGPSYYDQLLKLPVFNDVVSIALPSMPSVTDDACAIDKTAGGETKAVCWGSAEPVTSVPATVRNPTVIATNGTVACADSADGSVQCWGKDEFGSAPNRPRDIRKLAMATDVACVVDDFGLMCWGPATQIGQAMKVPDDLAMDGAVIDVALSSDKACALTFDHQVACWGGGDLRVPELRHPIAVSASNSTFCATDDDGVTCWGSPSDLPGGDPQTNAPVPRAGAGGRFWPGQHIDP